MCEARRFAALLAEVALERRADSFVAPLWLEHPRLGKERQPVADVLLMAADELGDAGSRDVWNWVARRGS